MKKFFRKMVVFMLFLSCIWLINWVDNIYAKNSVNKKNVVLSEKYTWKKLERAKNSLKSKKEYRFLIESTDSLNNISSYFKTWDKKAKVKKVSKNKFMVKLPLNSTFLSDELLLISNWVVPITIWWYKTIQLEIFEGFWTWSYLNGEEITKLWWQTKIWVDTFQEDLQTKNKIKVAILDTWIDYNHNDLNNNYNSSLSYDFINDDADALDDNGHGTQVAWIVWSEVNWAWTYWVNSNSDLVALKVLDANGLGTNYDVLEAIDYAKTNNIKVINISFWWFWDPSTSAVCQAITDAKNNWIYTIVSAWNGNTNISNVVPAWCADAITVWAVNKLDKKSSFSNFWTNVKVYAPWEEIYTTTLNNKYTLKNGTSFSAPFVSWIVAKELAFSWWIIYDNVLNNLRQNYNLVWEINIENTWTTVTNSTPIEFSTWVFVLPENLDSYYRFDDFRYLSIDANYVYYGDMKSPDKIYKLKLNDKWIRYPKEYYTKNPKIVFWNKDSIYPFYFNSWVYIKLSEYPNPELLKSLSWALNNWFVANQFTASSLWKYDINLKFDKISGKKIMDLNWWIIYSDNTYLYYNNSNDQYKLYRIKSDWTDANPEWTLFMNLSYIWFNRIEQDYIYYNNPTDEYKLYRIKKDWSDYNTWWTKVIDIPYSWWIFIDSYYIYYIDPTDEYKLYRIKKDWTEANTWWTKVIDMPNSSASMSDWEYIYYNNPTDEYKLYRIKKDWTESYTWWTKVIDIPYSWWTFIDLDYIYYNNQNDNNKPYRIKKDWSEISTWWIKIINAELAQLLISDDLYIYYNNPIDNYLLYRVKKDWSEVDTLWMKLSNKIVAYVMLIEWDYLFFTSGEWSNLSVYKVKKDWTWETKIADKYYSYVNNDSIYIYWFEGDYYTTNKFSYYKVKKDWTDTNLYIENNLIYNSSEITIPTWMNYIRINIDRTIPIWTNFKFTVSNNNSSFYEINESDLNWTTNINLNNLFWLTTDKLYYKIELLWDTSDTTKTPVINSVELTEWKLEAPTNLQQYVQSPWLAKQPIDLWEKIGKFQSGTWIILSAEWINEVNKLMRLKFEIYKQWEIIPIDTIYWAFTWASQFSEQVIVSYPWAWNYSWNVTKETSDWNASETREYGNNSSQWEYDYALFEWFEPYPYGYKFANSSPAYFNCITDPLSCIYPWKLLTWWFYWVTSTQPIVRSKIDWNKWELFDLAFDLSWLSDNQLFDSFEVVWLNRDDALQWWNCYGMAVSSAMQYTHPNFLQTYFPTFSSRIWNWTIWNNIDKLSTNWYGQWNEYEDNLKTILAFQLMQYNVVQNKNNSNYTWALNIFNTLKYNQDKTYVLNFYWKVANNYFWETNVWHAVVPYKVEEELDWTKRIYFRDNNIQYPKNADYIAYNQYIEINSTWSWVAPHYKDWISYTDMSLVDLNDIYNWNNKSRPLWFDKKDELITLSWSNDLYVVDTSWRISWFLSWSIFDEIPWVNVIVPLSDTLSWTTLNTWKQIYLPKKQDITIKIIWKWQEKYDLMIAWGDYYTKIENVETSTWKIDLYKSSNNNLNIDFGDRKKWKYKLLIDNFNNEKTKKNSTIYIDNIDTVNEPQNFDINWKEVLNNTDKSIVHEIDKDKDWKYNWKSDIFKTYHAINNK